VLNRGDGIGVRFPARRVIQRIRKVRIGIEVDALACHRSAQKMDHEMTTAAAVVRKRTFRVERTGRSVTTRPRLDAWHKDVG
jgi:hypothetical protein